MRPADAKTQPPSRSSPSRIDGVSGRCADRSEAPVARRCRCCALRLCRFSRRAAASLSRRSLSPDCGAAAPRFRRFAMLARPIALIACAVGSAMAFTTRVWTDASMRSKGRGLWHARTGFVCFGRHSSGVERTLGKGEVECSNHSGGTISQLIRSGVCDATRIAEDALANSAHLQLGFRDVGPMVEPIGIEPTTS